MIRNIVITDKKAANHPADLFASSRTRWRSRRQEWWIGWEESFRFQVQIAARHSPIYPSTTHFPCSRRERQRPQSVLCSGRVGNEKPFDLSRFLSKRVVQRLGMFIKWLLLSYQLSSFTQRIWWVVHYKITSAEDIVKDHSGSSKYDVHEVIWPVSHWTWLLSMLSVFLSLTYPWIQLLLCDRCCLGVHIDIPAETTNHE